MDVIPFWGCMIPRKYPQMEKAVRISMKKLGINLVEENRFSCCPDPIYFKAGDKLNWYTLAARNISLAEERGLDLVTVCSGCTSTLCEVNHHLKQDAEFKKQVNLRLKDIGRTFKGNIEVRHLVTVLRDNIGLEKIRSTLVQPFSELSVAIHYGCHLLKPSEIMQVEDPVYPNILSQLFEALGVNAINHEEYLLCCGKACRDQDLSIDMSYSVFKSVMDSGADCLGLICPTCFDSFDVGQLRISRKVGQEIKIPVVYYFQLLAIALGATPDDVGLNYHKIMPELFLEKLTPSTVAV